jgi:hypothetical protein
VCVVSRQLAHINEEDPEEGVVWFCLCIVSKEEVDSEEEFAFKPDLEREEVEEVDVTVVEEVAEDVTNVEPSA